MTDGSRRNAGSEASTHTSDVRAAPGHGALDAADLAERLALLVLLALIPLRAVIGETHTFESPRFLRNLDAPVGAQPATTLVIIGTIAAVAVLVSIARRLGRPRRYRWTGAEVGGLLLLAAGLISTHQAGQKHLVLVGGLDFLGMVAYLILLRQLLTRPWRIRLALAVILTTGAAIVGKCAYQHWRELPDTAKYYEEQKEALIGQPVDGGAAPQRGLQHDFEQRLKAGTISGYYQHPNLLGSHLILFILAALGAAASGVGRGRPRWAMLPPAAIVIGGGIALIGVQSKGAGAACAIGAMIWLMGHVGHRVVRLHPRLIALLLWLGIAGGAGLLVTALRPVPHDALGRSMQFRYMYWQGAWDMIRDRGVLGVGANNFGRHFTRYKPVECPEDVESPHSWVVQLAAEWGLTGLAGFMVVLVGVTWMLCRRPRSMKIAKPIAGHDPPGSIILWGGGMTAILLPAWLLVLADTPWDLMPRILTVAFVPGALFFVLLSVESKDSTEFADGPIGGMVPGLIAALVGFLLHSGIDLALFAGGPATSFFALAAVALAIRGLPSEIGAADGRSIGAPTDSAKETANRGEGLRRRGPGGRTIALAIAVCGCAGLAAYVQVLIRPAATLARDLRIARVTSPPPDWVGFTMSAGYRAYREAAEAYELDGTALEELADALVPRTASLAHVEEALGLARRFRARDPYNAAGDRLVSALLRRRFDFSGDVADLQRSIAACRDWVETYPSSPNRRIAFGALLDDYARITGDSAAAREAAEQLQAALELDGQRVYVSKPNRLTGSEREAIRARLERLGAGREPGP